MVVHHVDVDPVGVGDRAAAPARGWRSRRTGCSGRSARPHVAIRPGQAPPSSATLRSSARNIASVPCRCGHSCTSGPSPRCGTGSPAASANSGRASTTLDVDALLEHVADDEPGLVRGAGCRWRRRRRRRARVASIAERQQRALQRRRGRPGPPAYDASAPRAAAQRPEPGARCVDEDPVEGLRARPAADVATVAGADHDLDAGVDRAAERLADQVGAVLAASRWRTASAPDGARQRGEQRRLAARAGAHVQPATRSVDPVRRRHGSARGPAAATPSSCTAARPSRTAGDAAGVAAVQDRADRRQQRPRWRRPPTSSSTSARPGRATRETLAGALSATSRASRSASTVSAVDAPWPRSAARSARTIHSGWLCSDRQPARWGRPSGTTCATHVGRSFSLIRRITALTNPLAPAPLTIRASPTVSSTAAWAATRMPSSWWAPRRSVSRTLSSICATGRPAAAAMIGVVEAVQARRAVGQLGGERRRRVREIPLAAQLFRQLQVGVGAVGDGAHHRVGRQAGRVGRARPLRRAPRRSGAAVRGGAGAGQSSPSFSPGRAGRRGPSRRRPSASCRGAAPCPAGRRRWPVPTWTERRSATISPGAAGGPSATGATGSSLSRSPRKVVHAPGRGGAPADLPVDGERGPVPAHARVLDGDLGGERDPVARLRHGLERAARRPSSVATSSPAPAVDSRCSRSPAVSVGRIVSVITPYVGPVSRPSSSRNVVAPVTSSPAMTACWTGRGAAPGRQQREVQVDPAGGRHGQHRGRDAGRRTRRRGRRRGPARPAARGSRGHRRRGGVSTSRPSASARTRTGDGTRRAAAAGRASGRVRTATTSWARRRAPRGWARRPRGCRRRRAAPGYRPLPKVECGLSLDRGRRLTGPLGVADGLHRQLALGPVHAGR